MTTLEDTNYLADVHNMPTKWNRITPLLTVNVSNAKGRDITDFYISRRETAVILP